MRAIPGQKLLLFGLSSFLLLTIAGFLIAPCSSADEHEELSAAELGEIADQLEAIVQELDVVQRDIPRDTFDPRAIVQKVGTDPEKLFEWVRDNTYWVPYRGSLRGPTGVLMDRLGDSLDRALLLAELLDSTGCSVRLAHAQLSEEQARKLLPKIRPVPATARDDARRDLSGSARDAGRALDADVESAALRYARQSEEAARLITEHTAALLDAIGEFPPAQRGADAHAVRAMRDHWWVQYETENGWVDLEPLLPDAKPGAAVTEAEETIEPDELDDDLRHLVDVRIIVEQWDEGVLKEHTVLEHTLRPSELFGKRIVLYHYAMGWPEEAEGLGQEDDPSERLEEVVLELDEWLPALQIGPDVIFQSSFTDTGDINETPERGPAEKLGEGVRGMFGGFGGGGGTEPAEDKFLTAEWAEYEIRAPGGPARTIRREVFDLIGPAARASGKVAKPKLNDAAKLARGYALLGFADIAVLPCRVSGDCLCWQVAAHLRDEITALQHALNAADTHTAAELARRVLLGLESLHGPLWRWAQARHEWHEHGSDTYLDSVNVVALQTWLAADTDGGLRRRRVFDIVNNDVAVHRTAGAQAVLVRLTQGVADTVAERLVTGEPDLQQSVSAITELARAQGIGWRVIRSAKDSHLARRQLDHDVRARIEQDLAAGYAVLLPEQPVLPAGDERIGWWRVSLTSGEALGVMGSGFHGSASLDYIRAVNATIENHAATEGVLLSVDPYAAYAFVGRGFGFFLVNTGLINHIGDRELIDVLFKLHQILQRLLGGG